MSNESQSKKAADSAPYETKAQAITDSDMQALSRSPGIRLAKLMGVHLLVALLVLSLFAAAVSWSVVSGLGIASALSVATGALAGITLSTLIHEWFHYAGARYAGASFTVPKKLGLFLYDWHFDKNDQHQFLIMSVAGSVGGFLWGALSAATTETGNSSANSGSAAGGAMEEAFGD